MTKEVVLNVNGMTCTTCSITLQKRLGQLDGVLDSQASFETKTATIRYDPEKIAPSDLLKATQDIGYTAAVQQSPSGKESRDEY
jgi:copper chaperone CopZ